MKFYGTLSLYRLQQMSPWSYQTGHSVYSFPYVSIEKWQQIDYENQHPVRLSLFCRNSRAEQLKSQTTVYKYDVGITYNEIIVINNTYISKKISYL